MYLHSKDIHSFFTGGDITYVYAFSLIALFILLIACINYMNLVRRAFRRAVREVGMRKVVGLPFSAHQPVSERKHPSGVDRPGFTIGIVYFALPAFNSLTGTYRFPFRSQATGACWRYLLGIVVLIGIAAGSYPVAFLLSVFPVPVIFFLPVAAGLQRRCPPQGAGLFPVYDLHLLLIVTGVVYQQLEYCRNMDLGFDKEHLVLIEETLPKCGASTISLPNSWR
ncbi:MAG: hypothetical protein H6559_18835 [Lewinellaceae bacterium]|nr:hypothetical protein [Lewinellaceae bacterium]